jgi:flagellar hook-length control protein FliK
VSVARLGRIEADPLGVPVAASMQLGLREPFAQHLDAMVAAAPARAPAVPAPQAQRAEAKRARDDAPHRDDDAAVAAPARTPADVAPATTDPSAPAALAAGCTQNPVKGEPARRIPDGEGAGSPLTSPPRGEPALPAATTADATALPGGAAAPAMAGTAAGAAVGQAAATARVDAGAGARIGGGSPPAGQPAAAATTPKAAAAGYRTLTRQAVQLDEQAADSVFRQILFKLDKDRGEMRVHLEPPELGRLDLRLQVERNGDLRLSIGAERGDLAALLQKDLQPLVQALQQQGLHVVHAEVHAQTRGDGNRGERATDGAPDGAHRRADDGDGAALPRIGTGYVTAQGLDFWA